MKRRAHIRGLRPAGAMALAFGGLALMNAGAGQEPQAPPPKAVDARQARLENRKGVELYELQQYDDALDAFRRAADLNEASPKILYNLGTALARTERHPEANAVLESSPSEAAETELRRDSFYNLGYSRAQQALSATGSSMPPRQQLDQLIKARDAFRQAIITDPADDGAKYNFELADKLVERLENLLGDEEPPPPNSGKESGPEPEDQQQEQQSENDPSEQNEKDEQNQQEGSESQKKPEGEEQKSDEPPDPDAESQEDESQSTERDSNEDNPADPKEQERGLEQEGGQPPPEEPENAEAEQPEGAEPAEEPAQMTEAQMNALRILNTLEEDKPEQFKQLFKFRGKSKRTKWDW